MTNTICPYCQRVNSAMLLPDRFDGKIRPHLIFCGFCGKQFVPVEKPPEKEPEPMTDEAIEAMAELARRWKLGYGSTVPMSVNAESVQTLCAESLKYREISKRMTKELQCSQS